MENSKNDTLSAAEPIKLARAITSVLIEKKALDVKLYNLGEDNPVTDCYVVATGRSSTGVAALADEVTYKIGLMSRNELRVEGRAANTWLLVDYGDVIVHIFDRESRDFYNFDRLMPSGTEVDISDVIAEIDKKYEINNIKED